MPTVKLAPFSCASDTSSSLELRFVPVPDYPSGGADLYVAQMHWRREATRFIDALQAHAPGGFMNALLGELCLRKANVFIVRDKQPGYLPEDKLIELHWDPDGRPTLHRLSDFKSVSQDPAGGTVVTFRDETVHAQETYEQVIEMIRGDH